LAGGAQDTGWQATAGRPGTRITSGHRPDLRGGKFHNVDGVGGTGKARRAQPGHPARATHLQPIVAVLAYGIAVGPGAVGVTPRWAAGRSGDAFNPERYPEVAATTDGDVQAVAYLAGTVCLGGHYDNACQSANVGSTAPCLDGSCRGSKLSGRRRYRRPAAVGPAANGVHGVFTLATSTALGKVTAGGEFTPLHGVSRAYFAQFS